ncbi:MAG TPA: late competence development ComFB family protein [Spirochaetia bacterium]|nr:late competence development ComFB family protein [Spirochaetia bacterium]
MRLKNYNEDLVLDTVKIVLQDRTDVRPTRSLILDVAAYVLNRIPPKYITSERGFTREVVQAAGNGDEQRLVNAIELITHVNRAIDVVTRRRRESAPSRAKGRPASPSSKATDQKLTYFYNMPHIFGRVVDARDGKPVISARATLWINDKLSAPAETGWRNPFFTNEQTDGYFSFWPQVETGGTDSMRLQMKIGFEHDKYEPLEFRKSLKVPGELLVYDYIRGDKLLDVGTVTLQPAG